jgi:hypothetical protein
MTPLWCHPVFSEVFLADNGIQIGIISRGCNEGCDLGVGVSHGGVHVFPPDENR